MEINVLTTTLTTFVSAIHTAQHNIHAAGNGILYGLGAIEVILACLWIAFDGTELSTPFKKILQLTFWVYFSNNFTSWADKFRDSLVNLGLAGGGQAGNYKLLFDPSSIGGLALDATNPIVQSMHDAGLSHIGDVALMAICYAALIACFFIIACQLCVAVIEYYLIVTLASVLIPFGISQHTKFIAEKAIGAAIAVSIKLMVLSFVMGLVQPVITQMHFTGSGEMTLNQMLSMVLVCGLLAYVVVRAPGFAADLLAASPSLNAMAIGQSAVSAVSSGAKAASGAATGGRAMMSKGAAAAKAVGAKGLAAYNALQKTFGGGGKGGSAGGAGPTGSAVAAASRPGPGAGSSGAGSGAPAPKVSTNPPLSV